MILQAEKRKIHDGPAPRRFARGPRQRLVAKMSRGQWLIVTKTEARSMVEAIRELGGRGISYQTSERGWCFKVIEPIKAQQE